MYNTNITKEMWEELMKPTPEDRQWVVYGSPEFIERIEQAIEDEMKIMFMPNELEQKIIDLREDGYSYGGIQLKLGNPSKRFIKETLKKFRPELLGDVVDNPKKLKSKLYE